VIGLFPIATIDVELMVAAQNQNLLVKSDYYCESCGYANLSSCRRIGDGYSSWRI
jgi:hypothetical protein